MHAAIRKYELENGSAQELVHVVEDGLADLLSAEPGFVGYHVVASGVSLTGGDEIVALTFFDDQDSTVRSNEIAAEFVKERLQPFGLHLTSAMSGQVLLTRSNGTGTRSTSS